MTTDFINSDYGILFMKVGVHDGEAFEEILERKRTEIKKVGYSFWGYGGGTCHPVSQVQPFAKMQKEKKSGLYIAMETIHSNHQFTGQVATEFSIDGINWKPIPDDIEVRGSRYAVVLGELEEGDLDIDISHYRVAIGPSRERIGSDYIKGRVDKACLKYSPDMIDQQNVKHISNYGKIIDPYAVFVRN